MLKDHWKENVRITETLKENNTRTESTLVTMQQLKQELTFYILSLTLFIYIKYNMYIYNIYIYI